MNVGIGLRGLPPPPLCHMGVSLHGDLLTLPYVVDSRVALVLVGARPGGRWAEEQSRRGKGAGNTPHLGWLLEASGPGGLSSFPDFRTPVL